MKIGDIVYPFFEKENNTIGLFLGKKRSVSGQILARILNHLLSFDLPDLMCWH